MTRRFSWVVLLLGLIGAPHVGWTQELDEQAFEHADALSRAFRQAAAKVLPTVVAIETRSNARMQSMPGMQGSPFDELFGGQMPQRLMPQRAGLGSGVIIDASGIILTNNHVVAGADLVRVELSDGRKFNATDIKTDPDSDTAIIRITEAGPLPTATLGDSDKLQIGDWVLAVGSPFGLDDTVSAGIISAKGRSLEAAERAQFLQTDAAINPGNSGGPLVNLRGEVIGINTAIASDTGSNMGIGFAVPINLVRWVSDQLVRDGKVQRAYLGVGVRELNAELAEQFGGKLGQGVVVQSVFPGSPAEKAGLQFGDIITAFQKTPVQTPSDLQQAVEKVKVGSEGVVTLLRDGETRNVTVVVEELTATVAGARKPGQIPQRGGPVGQGIESTLGIQVQDLTARVASELGYRDRTSGVLVVGVDPNGPAAEQGIGRGMVILKVHKKEVLTVEQLREALKDESIERGILLLVATPNDEALIVVKGPAKK
jgi:serine protease Do